MTLLIGYCEDYATLGRFARNHTLAGFLFEPWKRIERNTADSCFGFFFDALLCFRCAVPVAKQESAFLYLRLEFFVRVASADMGGAEVKGFLVAVTLYISQELLYMLRDTL